MSASDAVGSFAGRRPGTAGPTPEHDAYERPADIHAKDSIVTPLPHDNRHQHPGPMHTPMDDSIVITDEPTMDHSPECTFYSCRVVTCGIHACVLRTRDSDHASNFICTPLCSNLHECCAVAHVSPRPQQEHTSAAPAVAHSMLSFNPMQSYAEDCLHDSIFKGSAPDPQPATVSPVRIAVPDTIEEENTGVDLVCYSLLSTVRPCACHFAPGITLLPVFSPHQAALVIQHSSQKSLKLVRPRVSQSE